MKYLLRSMFILLSGTLVAFTAMGGADASLNDEEMPQVKTDSRLPSGSVISGQTKEVKATRTIVVAGDDKTFTVEEDGSVTLIAGKTITLLPGTKINPGGSLRASIHTIARKAGVVKTGALDATNAEMKQAEEQKILSAAYTLFKPFPSPAKGTLHAGAEEQGSFSILSTDLMAVSPDTQRKLAIAGHTLSIVMFRMELSTTNNLKPRTTSAQVQYMVLRL